MNERIKQLADQAGFVLWGDKVALISGDTVDWSSRYDDELEKFAELIVKECRNVLTDVYRETPLELCGPLLTADEKIAEHFYGVEE